MIYPKHQLAGFRDMAREFRDPEGEIQRVTTSSTNIATTSAPQPMPAPAPEIITSQPLPNLPLWNGGPSAFNTITLPASIATPAPAPVSYTPTPAQSASSALYVADVSNVGMPASGVATPPAPATPATTSTDTPNNTGKLIAAAAALLMLFR